MWALKPPRRPAKKNIRQDTPERTPPEPDAAPEQALPPGLTTPHMKRPAPAW